MRVSCIRDAHCILSKQRQLADALGAVVLEWASVGLEAVLAGGGGGLAMAEDFLHGGNVHFYLTVLFLQGGG